MTHFAESFSVDFYLVAHFFRRVDYEREKPSAISLKNISAHDKNSSAEKYKAVYDIVEGVEIIGMSSI